MPTDAPLAPSGIGPVEVIWGGLARPGAYLLVGAARQGRLHLAAQAAGGAVAAGERVLVFSGRETEAVTGLAREADVDLADAYRRGLARLLRVPAAKDLAALGEAGLTRAMIDMAAAAKGTSRVVIEDFTPFVQFRSFDAFSTAFRRLIADVAAHGATLVLGLGEPANDGSRRLLDFVQGEVTGTLHVRPDAGGYLLTLTPGTGHAGQGH
ncbi:MAG TPA: hypothetical protein VK610_07185, partial [Rhodothermales bacterium]|nr:hypothetical protein [Rhodothermales bacterium]